MFLKRSDSIRRFGAGLILVLSGACAPGEVVEPALIEIPSGPVVVWETSAGIDTPESAWFDPDSGFIFVSQIAGEPDGRDGNGRIVQLSADGAVLSEAWASGFNAPKGLRGRAGVLWTADIDEIVGIDIATAQVVTRVRVEGAQFLNDVAVGEDGTVYVSDMAATRIYALRDGVAEVFAEGEQLEWPNGLLIDGNRLIVGGWGRPEADFTTLVPGRLYALDLETRAKTLITPEPFANIDGVESDGRGGWLVTDYLAGKLMRVASNGTVTDLQVFGPGTADLGFVAGSGIAIIPHMQENRVAAYDISGMLE